MLTTAGTSAMTGCVVPSILRLRFRFLRWHESLVSHSSKNCGSFESWVYSAPCHSTSFQQTHSMVHVWWKWKHNQGRVSSQGEFIPVVSSFEFGQQIVANLKSTYSRCFWVSLSWSSPWDFSPTGCWCSTRSPLSAWTPPPPPAPASTVGTVHSCFSSEKLSLAEGRCLAQKRLWGYASFSLLPSGAAMTKLTWGEKAQPSLLTEGQLYVWAVLKPLRFRVCPSWLFSPLSINPAPLQVLLEATPTRSEMHQIPVSSSASRKLHGSPFSYCWLFLGFTLGGIGLSSSFQTFLL